MECGCRPSCRNRHFFLTIMAVIALALMGCAPHLNQVIKQGNKALAIEMIENAEAIDMPDNKTGSTALVFASYYSDEEIVNLLLQKGADVNTENNVKNTPLMLAARKGNLKILKRLLQSGAAVNSQNIAGETALHNSSIEGHYEIARLLIENNANVNMLTKNLKSPMHFSMLEGDHKNIAALLLESGAELDPEKTFLTDSPMISSARDAFAAVRLYKLAGEIYYQKGMHRKALESYKVSAQGFNLASEKFLALSKNQKSKEERAKFINILSGIGYLGAAGTGTSSTWSFQDTDKYKTLSEASIALSTICEEYAVQCRSIVECYHKHGFGDELAACVSESQPEISKSKAGKKK